MFFKPNTLIYIQRSGILIAGKRLPTARIDYPEDVVKNLEVLQPTKLADIFKRWLSEHNIHGKRILIVLDTSVIFEKTIELDKSGQPDILLQGFVDAMPFEPGKRACIAVQSAADLRLFAANADLYTIVADALREANAGKLVAITPSAAYNLASDQRTVNAASERFFSDTDVRSSVDFRSVTPA